MRRETRMAAPVSFIRLLAITPASETLNACSEVVRIRLKEIVFVLEEEDGVLLLALLNIEAKTISMTRRRERQTIHCSGFFIFEIVGVAFDAKLVRPDNGSREPFLFIDIFEGTWADGADELDVGLWQFCLHSTF